MARSKTDTPGGSPKDGGWCDTLSPKHLRHVLDEEITQVMKGAELRLRELAQISTLAAAGELTPEEATRRYERYHEKWGDALPGGIMMAQGQSDKALLAAIEGGGGSHAGREGRRRHTPTRPAPEAER